MALLTFFAGNRIVPAKMPSGVFSPLTEPLASMLTAPFRGNEFEFSGVL